MIDTHLHLIDPERFSYPWTSGIPELRGLFFLDEYRRAFVGHPWSGSIFMEVDVDEAQSGDEARFFCETASDPASGILGVIAAARPELPSFAQYLDSIAHPHLLGIRRVLHTQPDELSTTARFRKNLRMLASRDLSFDLCVQQRQLPLASELVDAAAEVRFVLDHCGVPEIATNRAPEGEGFLEWKKAVSELSRRPNVFGKISGISAYAPRELRTVEGLRPYVETMLEAFTPSRLVWGGDWPVVNLGFGLPAWLDLTLQLLAELSPAEKQAVFESNARAIYKIRS